MAHTYKYEQFGVYHKFEGKVEAGADYKFHQSFQNYPNIEYLRYLLIDTIEVSELDPAVPYVFASIDKIASTNIKNLNIIFVTDNNEYENAFRIYENNLHDSDWSFHICSSVDEGRELIQKLNVTS